MTKDNKNAEIEKLKAEVEWLKKELKKRKKYGLVWEREKYNLYILLTFNPKFHILIFANGNNTRKVIIVKLYYNVKRNVNNCKEY